MAMPTQYPIARVSWDQMTEWLEDGWDVWGYPSYWAEGPDGERRYFPLPHGERIRITRETVDGQENVYWEPTQ